MGGSKREGGGRGTRWRTVKAWANGPGLAAGREVGRQGVWRPVEKLRQLLGLWRRASWLAAEGVGRGIALHGRWDGWQGGMVGKVGSSAGGMLGRWIVGLAEECAYRVHIACI